MIDKLQLKSELKKYFGFDTFKGNQEPIIDNLLAGKDTFVLMPTGGGKSLCYQLPSLMIEGTAIVISPLIALMKNQVDAMRNYGEEDGIAHFLNSSLNAAAIDKVKEDVVSGKTRLLYVAPESLLKWEEDENGEKHAEVKFSFLKKVKISFYAVDEAHCISEWGHDFRPEYRNIRRAIDILGRAPIIALTATATPKVQHDILKTLNIMDATVFKSSFNRPNLYYEIRPKITKESAPNFVDNEIVRFIKANSGKSGIIYCLSRKKVEELAEKLRANNIRALAYHAGMDSFTRSAIQEAFLLGEVNIENLKPLMPNEKKESEAHATFLKSFVEVSGKSIEAINKAIADDGQKLKFDGEQNATYIHAQVDVIVATIAFGMGIDKPDVRFVIHYDMPKSLEGYYQETGRAGRDGGEGKCVTFYSKKDLDKLLKFMQNKQGSEQEIGKQLLAETALYAESSVCRRITLLHYFGEDYKEDNCGNCDNCIHQKNRVKATDELCATIEAIISVREKFKTDYVVNMLLGVENSEIRSYRHEQLEVFGACKGRDERFIRAVIAQAMIAGYIDRDIENYGVLKITDEGFAFYDNPTLFQIVEDNDFSETEESEAMVAGANALDPELYSILKDLRRKVASQKGLPAYVIFQDASLEAMATTYPITMDELQNIPGVGAGKAKRYGNEFIKIIKKHVEVNEIERPLDVRVKTVANKSKNKIYLIQGIDRRVSLDALAQAKGLEFEELLDELESIVNSGTKINIDYYIDELMDEDHMLDIFEYFRESETDDLKAALDELGPDYTEEEVRLVRIKFISEMGN